MYLTKAFKERIRRLTNKELVEFYLTVCNPEMQRKHGLDPKGAETRAAVEETVAFVRQVVSERAPDPSFFWTKP